MAVTLDTTSNNGATPTSKSWSHTIGAGSNRLLLVGVAIEEAGGVTSVTAGGVEMSYAVHAEGGGRRSYIYYLGESGLTTGATTITVFTAEDIIGTHACSASFFGAAQQGPTDTATTVVASGTSATHEITTLDGSVHMDVIEYAKPNAPVAFSTGQTEIQESQAGGHSSSVAYELHATGSTANETASVTGVADVVAFASAVFAAALAGDLVEPLTVGVPVSTQSPAASGSGSATISPLAVALTVVEQQPGATGAGGVSASPSAVIVQTEFPENIYDHEDGLLFKADYLIGSLDDVARTPIDLDYDYTTTPTEVSLPAVIPQATINFGDSVEVDEVVFLSTTRIGDRFFFADFLTGNLVAQDRASIDITLGGVQKAPDNLIVGTFPQQPSRAAGGVTQSPDEYSLTAEIQQSAASVTGLSVSLDQVDVTPAAQEIAAIDIVANSLAVNAPVAAQVPAATPGALTTTPSVQDVRASLQGAPDYGMFFSASFMAGDLVASDRPDLAEGPLVVFPGGATLNLDSVSFSVVTAAPSSIDWSLSPDVSAVAAQAAQLALSRGEVTLTPDTVYAVVGADDFVLSVNFLDGDLTSGFDVPEPTVIVTINPASQLLTTDTPELSFAFSPQTVSPTTIDINGLTVTPVVSLPVDIDPGGDTGTVRSALLGDLSIFLNIDEFAVRVSINGSNVDGIFDNEWLLVPGGEIGVSSTEPVFMCRTSDVEDVQYGDPLIYGHIQYSIRDVQQDGTGMTTLILELAQ